MNIRIVQMEIGDNREVNLEHGISLLHKQPLDSIDIVIFPELFTVGYNLPTIKNNSYSFDDTIVSRFCTIAKVHSVAFVLGSLPWQTLHGIYNKTFIISKKGAVISDYSKVHLFSLMEEEKYFKRGKEWHDFTLDSTPMSSIICYDLRFPELMRKAVIQCGAKVVFVPMQWPAPRTEAFKTLLRARAVENQCYIVSCNRVGKSWENGAIFEGASMVVDPYGNDIILLDNCEQIVDVDIDISIVDKVRTHMDCFSDRQEYIYEQKRIVIQEEKDHTRPELRTIYDMARKDITCFNDDKITKEEFFKITEGERLFTASIEGAIIGFIALWEQDSFVHHLYIDPQYQNRGVGKKLLYRAYNELTFPITLKTPVENIQACQFYDTLGWKVKEYGDDPLTGKYAFYILE